MYIVNNEKPSGYMFLSTSPNPDSDKSILSLDHVLDMPVLGGHFVSGIRGLLCLRTERRMQICNLTTKQLVELELPTITHEYVWNNFGHDPVQDEYKVLNKGKSSDIQIQVSHIGPQATWRNTQSDAIPRPCSQGISITCVLYYKSSDGKIHYINYLVKQEVFCFACFPNEFCHLLSLADARPEHSGKIWLGKAHPDRAKPIL